MGKEETNLSFYWQTFQNLYFLTFPWVKVWISTYCTWSIFFTQLSIHSRKYRMWIFLPPLHLCNPAHKIKLNIFHELPSAHHLTDWFQCGALVWKQFLQMLLQRLQLLRQLNQILFCRNASLPGAPFQFPWKVNGLDWSGKLCADTVVTISLQKKKKKNLKQVKEQWYQLAGGDLMVTNDGRMSENWYKWHFCNSFISADGATSSVSGKLSC